MGKSLVVAEKPSVGRDYAAFLGCTEKHDGYMEGKDYIVTWAFGHLVGIKNPEEINPKWGEWSLEPLPFKIRLASCLKVLPESKEQFEIIKSLIHRPDVTEIINGGDAGIEGSLIQTWIYFMAGNTKPVKVLWASSFTEEELRRRFSDLRENSEFRNMREQGYSRALGDWMYGMTYSRALTKTFGQARNSQGKDTLLIYGRCQTPLLYQIALRDEEISNFKSEPYFNIKAEYREGYEGTLVDQEHKAVKASSADEAKSIMMHISDNGKNAAFKVDEFNIVKKHVQPPLLSSLADMQKILASQYGFDSATSLEILQILYEKHHITSYPRSGSGFLSTAVAKEIRSNLRAISQISIYKPLVDAIDPRVIDNYVSSRYVDDSKIEDHYAIIPTESRYMGQSYTKLNERERKVFDTVVRGFLASFYPDYEYSSTTMIVKAKEYYLLSRGTTPLKLGYRAVLSPEQDITAAEESKGKKNPDEPSKDIPLLSVGDTVYVRKYKVDAKKTSPPPRYNIKTIIELCEKYNIGTAATRAEIIKKLQRKNACYVVLNEKKQYCSTELGRTYIKMIPMELKDALLTQRFEERLEIVGAGKMTKEEFADQIYNEQVKYIEKFKAEGPKQAVAISESAAITKDSGRKGTCPNCKSPIRFTDKGYFCTHPRCPFKLWPTAKVFGNEIKITPAAAEDMLNESSKRRHKFKLKKKTGEDYEAYLSPKLTKVGDKFYTNLEIVGFPRHRRKRNIE